MDLERKSLRIGAAVIGCAVLLRLLSGSLIGNTAQFLGQSDLASWILFFETGRFVRPVPDPEETLPPETQPETIAPTDSELPETVLPVFSPSDAELVALHNYTGYSVDIQAMLQQPLQWELTGDEPTVLILHTHGTESYKEQQSDSYRSQDIHANVVSVGTYLAQLLEQAGISVIHDQRLHDDPSYNGAYTQSRESVQAYLKQYPSIRLVLDLHRDSIEDSSGQQVAYTLSTGQGTAAKLMLVMGTDAGGLNYPNWEENLSLAVKLQAQLEKNTPGLCRPISFRSSRFNQDLSPGAVLVEMGSAGNSRQEALRAAELLSKAIVDLAHGSAAPTATVSSTN